jgi:hypothetical protein
MVSTTGSPPCSTAKLAEAKVNLRAIYLTGVVDNLVELAIVTDDANNTKRLLQ